MTAQELRDRIGDYVCTPWLVDEETHDVLFLDESCPDAADSKLDPLVEAAILEATRDCVDLLPLAGDAYERIYPVLDAGGDHASVRSAVLGVFWADPQLGETVLYRTQMRLAERGVTCGDCEAPSPLPVHHRDVSWSELLPYVSAYVWPVQGDGAVEVYVCGGTNGLAVLEEDDRLARAAFLLAVHLTRDRRLEQLLSDLENRSASIAEYRGQIGNYLADERTQDLLCEQVTKFEWFLRMNVAACSSKDIARFAPKPTR